MKMPLSDVCYCGSKKGERMREDFEVVAAALKKKYPAVDEVHEFLVGNGLRDALRGNTPTASRGARQIIAPTIGLFRDLATGHSPVIKSFKAVTISAGMVYGNPESLTLLQGWDDDWEEKKKLEAAIGYKISDLKVATVDASDLVNVAGSLPWESKTVPKNRTTKDEHGEPVLKRLRDEGKKPATCGACGHKWPSKSQVFRALRGAKGSSGSFIACARCGQFAAKYD